MTSALLDKALDRSVLACYTNLGYRIRHRGRSSSELHRVDRKVRLVIGATSALTLAAVEPRAADEALRRAVAKDSDLVPA